MSDSLWGDKHRGDAPIVLTTTVSSPPPLLCFLSFLSLKSSTMPRIKLTLGALPPGLSTRTRNKEQHPGVPDLPKPRRPHAEVQSLKNAEIESRKEKEDIRADAIRRAAAIEDDMQTEDDEQATSGGQQWRDNNTYSKCSTVVTSFKSDNKILTYVIASSGAEDEPAIESGDDGSSVYQPDESGEDEIDPESNREDLHGRPAKTQTRKKRQEGVRTTVQLARSLGPAGEKRKLPVEMEKSVNLKK